MNQLFVNNNRVDIVDASLDALYRARAHGWCEVFSSLTPSNIFGQRYSSGPRWNQSRADYYDELRDRKQRLIESRGIPQIEDEIIRRGHDPKAKDFTRVSARFASI